MNVPVTYLLEINWLLVAAFWSWDTWTLSILRGHKVFHFFRKNEKVCYNFSGKIIKMIFPDGNYMFKVNNKNTRTSCGISSKLIIKAPEW